MTSSKGTSKALALCSGLILLLLIIDQASKIWVKTSMVEGEMIEIVSWFKLYFVENEGMAYGITIGSKLLLTLFRIIAMSAGLYYLIRIIRMQRFSLGFLLTLSLVIAGGFGNIIDCLFYGEIFSSSRGAVAQLVPWGSGYGDFLHGKVVDMLYFPIIRTTYPEWSPVHAGEPFIFFSPIFNFADACISVGVVLLLLFYRRSFSLVLELLSPQRPEETDSTAQ
nr:lipoprotein signal peptidase [uncultured Porphyromonas sp.]